MPRKKSGLFDQSKYIQQYIHDNVKHIKVSLNKNKPEDMQIIAWIAQQPEGASGYIKRLIREDMDNQPIYLEAEKIGTIPPEKIYTPDVIPFPDED